MFGESLAWRAEDLRQERGLPETAQVLDEADFSYFQRQYHWLRREHARVAAIPHFNTAYQIHQFLHQLNEWGFSLLSMTGQSLQKLATVLPGWYQQRISKLLGITVPRIYARRFYNLILGHQAIMSEREGRDVSIEEAAKDWYTHYHLPAILLLRRILTSGQDPMPAYFAIMRHKWKMSQEVGYEVPLDEAIIDWAMQQAETGKLGAVDPALMARWWRELEPTTQVFEPPLIESGALEPLLSPEERPLVHLPQPELEQKLPEILENDQE